MLKLLHCTLGFPEDIWTNYYDIWTNYYDSWSSIKGILGGGSLTITNIWGDQPAVTGRYNLPRYHQSKGMSFWEDGFLTFNTIFVGLTAKRIPWIPEEKNSIPLVVGYTYYIYIYCIIIYMCAWRCVCVYIHIYICIYGPIWSHDN